MMLTVAPSSLESLARSTHSLNDSALMLTIVTYLFEYLFGKKPSCYTCIQNEMTQNNWSGWKWESLLQESLVWSAWTRLPKPLFYLATPSACMVHFQELSQMTLKTSSNHCKSLCKRLSCKDISVFAASFYRLFSRGLPTDDWINSPVGSDWDTILRTLIKTFKLTY